MEWKKTSCSAYSVESHLSTNIVRLQMCKKADSMSNYILLLQNSCSVARKLKKYSSYWEDMWTHEREV